MDRAYMDGVETCRVDATLDEYFNYNACDYGAGDPMLPFSRGTSVAMRTLAVVHCQTGSRAVMCLERLWRMSQPSPEYVTVLVLVGPNVPY